MRVKGYSNLAKKNRKSVVHSTQDEHTKDNNYINKDSDDCDQELINVQDDEPKHYCHHLNKAVINLNSLKKIIKAQTIGE